MEILTVQKLLMMFTLALISLTWALPWLLLAAGAIFLLGMRASRMRAAGLSEYETMRWLQKRMPPSIIAAFILAILYTTAIFYMKFF